MIIREDYYGLETGRVFKRAGHRSLPVCVDASGIGILCLKPFLNRIGSGDKAESLAFARGFLVCMATGAA